MNNRLKGYVVASDKEHDISIIKIVDKDFESFGKIPYVVGKALVDVGDNIFVLGYPMTDTMGEEVKLTDGIISAGSGYKGDVSMYQISAAVQPGNSGGPVFNLDGNVIGIVCGKHSNAENANYAIKTSYLYSLLNSANVGIVPIGENNVKNKELSKKVEQLKNYVYIIECSSR
jgi:S1-C subfamily serine protease